MKSLIRHLFNPLNWYRAARFRARQRLYDRSAFDLELWLYARILPGGMLHYGYFEDGDISAAHISLSAMETAQKRYAELLLGELAPPPLQVLDAGCGMGGLTSLLLERGYSATALSPNRDQVRHVRESLPGAAVLECKFEDMPSAGSPFDVVIHSESLQYIPLDSAFRKMESVLKPGGLWVVSDYFRLSGDAGSASGHVLGEFLQGLERLGWRVEQERDITRNVLPTLRLVWLYAQRFLLPLKHFGLEKFRFKAPFWFFLTTPLHRNIDGKLERELAAVDPERFQREKRYLVFVIRRPG